MLIEYQGMKNGTEHLKGTILNASQCPRMTIVYRGMECYIEHLNGTIECNAFLKLSTKRDVVLNISQYGTETK